MNIDLGVNANMLLYILIFAHHSMKGVINTNLVDNDCLTAMKKKVCNFAIFHQL